MAVGQFFSQRFGYAVHALAYVARKPSGELATLPELAAWMRTIWPNVSESYLSNVVQRLARGRLLRSHRGIAGGYSLGRAAAKISLRDLVELLEGVDNNRCGLSLEDVCPVQARCTIQRKLRSLEEGYLLSLERMTIEELSEDIVVSMPKKTRT
ncbi:MAG: Rrf2 family transcriptional regulator [Planctomycetes bacterium]|nr:Rrf2 family transcriptional regulator [Planctomycetota bacterium]